MSHSGHGSRNLSRGLAHTERASMYAPQYKARPSLQPVAVLLLVAAGAFLTAWVMS